MSYLPGFIKVIPHTLKQTGRFDPNHMDFDTFCGLSHTRRTALPLSIAMLAYIVLLCALFGGLHIYSVSFISLGYIPFAMLLIVGIFKEWHLLMIPFIVLLLATILYIVVCIPLLMFAVFRTDSHLFQFFEKQTMTMGTVDGQTSILLLVIISTLSCTVGTFTVWSMYVHFCYIRGCKQMAQQQLDSEKRSDHLAKWKSMEDDLKAPDTMESQKNIC